MQSVIVSILARSSAVRICPPFIKSTHLVYEPPGDVRAATADAPLRPSGDNGTAAAADAGAGAGAAAGAAVKIRPIKVPSGCINFSPISSISPESHCTFTVFPLLEAPPWF